MSFLGGRRHQLRSRRIARLNIEGGDLLDACLLIALGREDVSRRVEERLPCLVGVLLAAGTGCFGLVHEASIPRGVLRNDGILHTRCM